MRAPVPEGTRRLAWHEVPDPQRRHEREAIVRPWRWRPCDLDWLMIPSHSVSDLLRYL